MRTVLARLELVSNGTTASYNSSGGHHHQDNLYPPGDTQPPHLYWRRLYERERDADNEDGCRDVLHQARADLERITGRYQRPHVTGETAGEQIARMLTETQGWTPHDVELSRWRMPARQVRRHRVNAGRDPETAQPPTNLKPADRRATAARLRQQGYSTRAIAATLAISQTMVRFDLARHDRENHKAA